MPELVLKLLYLLLCFRTPLKVKKMQITQLNFPLTVCTMFFTWFLISIHIFSTKVGFDGFNVNSYNLNHCSYVKKHVICPIVINI